jgi:hypothetical protein
MRVFRFFLLLSFICLALTLGFCAAQYPFPDSEVRITLTGPDENELNELPTLTWEVSGNLVGMQVLISDTPNTLEDHIVTDISLDFLSTMVNSAFDFTPTMLTLSNEKYYWTVRGYNDFRYFETESKIFYTQDEIAPTIEFAFPACDESIIPSEEYTFRGTITENWGIEHATITIGGGTPAELSITPSQTITHTYDWVYTGDLSQHAIGSLDLLLEAVDINGNHATQTCTIVVSQFADDFHDGKLDEGWTALHYDGDGEVIESNGIVRLNSGEKGGDFLGTNVSGSILYRTVPNGDFEATIHFTGVTVFSYLPLVGLFCDATDPQSEFYLVQSSCCGDPNGSDHWGILSRKTSGSSPHSDLYKTNARLVKDFSIKIARVNGHLGFFFSTDNSSFSPFSSPMQNYTSNCTLQHIGLLTGGSPVTYAMVLVDSFTISQIVSDEIKATIG